MQAREPAPFEVYCERCRVTFPLGTRRCIHCGGRTSTSRGDARARLEPADAPEIVDAEVDPDLGLGRRRFLSPVTLMWIVLIAAGYLYRACSGQSP